MSYLYPFLLFAFMSCAVCRRYEHLWHASGSNAVNQYNVAKQKQKKISLTPMLLLSPPSHSRGSGLCTLVAHKLNMTHLEVLPTVLSLSFLAVSLYKRV